MTIDGVEMELTKMQADRQRLHDQVRKIDHSRVKTGDISRQRSRLQEELEEHDKTIDSLRSRLRRLCKK